MCFRTRLLRCWSTYWRLSGGTLPSAHSATEAVKRSWQEGGRCNSLGSFCLAQELDLPLPLDAGARAVGSFTVTRMLQTVCRSREWKFSVSENILARNCVLLKVSLELLGCEGLWCPIWKSACVCIASSQQETYQAKHSSSCTSRGHVA